MSLCFSSSLLQEERRRKKQASNLCIASQLPLSLLTVIMWIKIWNLKTIDQRVHRVYMILKILEIYFWSKKNKPYPIKSLYTFASVITYYLVVFVFSLTWSSIPLCTLINQFLARLAQKFPTTKFLKSVSTTCIPNYPDKHLPTIFIYHEEDMKKQFVGPMAFGGMNLKLDGKFIGSLALVQRQAKIAIKLNSVSVLSWHY